MTDENHRGIINRYKTQMQSFNAQIQFEFGHDDFTRFFDFKGIFFCFRFRLIYTKSHQRLQKVP